MVVHNNHPLDQGPNRSVSQNIVVAHPLLVLQLWICILTLGHDRTLEPVSDKARSLVSNALNEKTCATTLYSSFVYINENRRLTS